NLPVIKVCACKNGGDHRLHTAWLRQFATPCVYRSLTLLVDSSELNYLAVNYSTIFFNASISAFS
ncbi:hypothetical protein, partial [Citrobacter portucalensis]|uniref:hypothetical protein n=1 Tax=Citrobacter portucalensis TaxID=1639133 RepID=UPI001F1F5888